MSLLVRTRRPRTTSATGRWSRRTVAAVAITGLVVIPGCGGGGGDGDSDGSGPTDVIKNFAAAYADGDGEAACRLMTGPAQRALLAGEPCASGLKAESESLGEEERRALRTVTIANARVEGNRATIEDADIRSEEGRLPEDIDPSPTVLEKIDGKWKITDPG